MFNRAGTSSLDAMLADVPDVHQCNVTLQAMNKLRTRIRVRLEGMQLQWGTVFSNDFAHLAPDTRAHAPEPQA